MASLIVTLTQQGAICLLLSPPIVEELVGVLREKFAWSADRLADLADALLSFTYLVVPQLSLSLSSDPDDNRILECAHEAGADVIVSGDDHLLKLGSFGQIPIMRPRQFLDTLNSAAC